MSSQQQQASSPQGLDDAREVKRLRKHNARLQERVNELQRKLAVAENRIDDLQVELDVMNDTMPTSASISSYRELPALPQTSAAKPATSFAFGART